MILTVTLSPSVDKTYTAGELIIGHMNKMRTAKSIAGGKGINVTKILRQYAYPVCATGFLGGYAGNFIEGCLKEEDVECRFVRIEGETGININILADNGYATALLEPGPEISEKQLKKFLFQYDIMLSECELVILSGNIARGLPEDIYAVLIERAKIKGIKTILDTSGEALKKGINAKPYMIKPNQKELEYIVGHKLVNREAVMEAALAVHAGGVAHVIVSMGKKGLMAVSGGKVFFANAGRVNAINTVGCGDSVVASYAMSIIKGERNEQALQQASAISAAAAMTVRGDEIPKETVEELLDKVTVEKLR